MRLAQSGAAAPPVWWATLAGLCASLVGIGLARFAYTPLIPALIAAGWFTPAQAAYLGAANFAGYLAGALAASRLARLPARHVLRAMMLLATLAFLACARPVSFQWFTAWRFAAGWAGGVLMVLAAPSILPFVPSRRRGVASGAIFTGVGLGIAASGVLVPPLLRLGVGAAWLGLGGVAVLLTALAWGGWPHHNPVPPPATAPGRGTGRALWAVVIAYGLNAAGLVPHMVFLVDYVARGLGRGLPAGALCWVAFGAGAVCGPLATGTLADRIGFVPAFRLALLIQAAAVAVPLISTAPAALLASALLAGVFAPGIVVLALGRIHLLSAPGSNEARAGWRLATIAWAVGQAAAAYAFSYAYSRTGSYWPLFATGTALLLIAMATDLVAGTRYGRRAMRGAPT
jgi:predicted MFS family arabinose efflux permease